MNSERLLTRKDVFKVWFNWMWVYLSIQNMERMQAPGVVRAMWTVKDKLYPGDKESQQDLLIRHMEFFNTEPTWGGLIVGIALAIEEERAMNSDAVPAELSSSIKTALMGPCAGLFDSLYQSTLIPILLAIGIGISSETGSVIGPLVYIVLYWAIVPTVSWFLFYNAYRLGINGVQKILVSGIKDKIISAANVVGLTVIGAVTASTCTISSGLVFSYGEMTVNVNDIITGIQPKPLVLVGAFLTYWLLAKKRISVNKIMLIMLLVSVVGYFTTILA